LQTIYPGERAVDPNEDTITDYRIIDDQPPQIFETCCKEGVDDNEVLHEEFDGYGKLVVGTDPLYAAFAHLLALRWVLFVSRKSGLHGGCLPHLLRSLRRIT
jgi:hypothetical protein